MKKNTPVRKMWASSGKVGKMHLSFQVYATREEATNYGEYPKSVAFPVLVLDASPAAMERHVEAMAWGLADYFMRKPRKEAYMLPAIAAFAALTKGRK